MLERIGLFNVDESEAAQTLGECERRGWRVFRLPEGLISKEAFFEGVRGTLPLDPPLQSNRSWDALSDSLWSGLDSLSDDKIVIVWPDASFMQAQAPEDFAIATDILADLPTSLADADITAGRTKKVLVLQVG